RFQQSSNQTAFQQRPIVAKRKVKRSPYGDTRPSVDRQMIVERLDIRLHGAAVWIRRVDLRAEHEQERLTHALMNHRAERDPIDIDAGLAPRIVVTELRGLRSAERVAKHADAREVNPACEAA